MATLTPQIQSAATQINFVAATSGGDTIATASGATLRVVNGSGSTVTVTIAGVKPCNFGNVVHASAHTVAAGKEEDIAVPGHCIADDGTAGVTYSAVTSLTVAAVR